jgi:regulation of enolase protein 1 (concanavalin A-like superfamily)
MFRVRVSGRVVLVCLAAVALCRPAGFVQAQSSAVPSPWIASDIGSPTSAGSTTYDSNSGTFSIDAGGADIWGTSDQFRFVYQQVSGDVDVVARVDSLTQADVWSKAGVMIRSSLAANAAQGSALVSAGMGTEFERRTQTGGSSTNTAVSGSAPRWVRLVRAGTQVTAYTSATGTTWTTIDSDTIALGTSAYVGIAVTSHNSTMLTSTDVSQVSIGSSGGTSSPPPNGFPSPQQDADIGNPAIAGSASYSQGVYAITAAGTDIWGTADQFNYVYQPVTGDLDVNARVASLAKANRWSKAGVMIRESLSANSRQASMFISVSRGYAFQRRPETGGLSDGTAGGSGSPPGWVRLKRSGTLFTAYTSTDGHTWNVVGSDDIAMGDAAYVGIAVTSHNANATTSASVDNLSITQSQPTNQPPTVSLTAPANGTSYTAPATIMLTASASDPEGQLAKVEFYAGSTLLGTDTASPYTFPWSKVAAGSYSLTAVAYDAAGNKATSNAVSVTVGNANQPPTVSLTAPLSGTSYVAPAAITLTASASDPEGALTKVEFYAGSTLLATDTATPYTFIWSNVAAGTYSLTAVAYDAAGAKTTSAAVSVTMMAATPPPRAVVFQASPDDATLVDSYRLDVFASNANPATATPIASVNLGKPTPDASGLITADQSAFFTGLAVGDYLGTVSAIGTGGESRSGSVVFSR